MFRSAASLYWNKIFILTHIFYLLHGVITPISGDEYKHESPRHVIISILMLLSVLEPVIALSSLFQKSRRIFFLEGKSPVLLRY
jgi:hypothetical protein